MAAKGKDFSQMNTGKASTAGGNAGKVISAAAQATSEKGQQGTASPQEAAERAAQLRTQGRKGCKAVRINMAFTPDNHEFIKIMASITGHTMTEFTNIVVERYRNEHPELYAQAKAIKDSL